MVVHQATAPTMRSSAPSVASAKATSSEPLDNYELPTRNDMLMRKYSGVSPVVGGALGLGAGLLLDQLGHVATGVLGAAIGVPVGLIGGFLAGGLVDLIFKICRGSKHKMGNITSAGTILGGIAGGVGGYMTGANLGVHPALLLVPAGVQIGLAAHKGLQVLARDKTSPVRDLYKSVKADPAKYNEQTAKPVLQSLRDLEKKGWQIDKTDGVLGYLENPSKGGIVSVRGKGSSLASDIPVDKVERLRNWVMGEKLDQLEDPKLAWVVNSEQFVSDAGLGGIRGSSAPDAKDDFWKLESLKAYDELRAGNPINLWHDGLAFKMDPARGITVEQFLKEAKDLSRLYDEALGPAYKADTLSKSQAEGLFNGMLRLADAGAYPSIQEAGQAMGRWAEASKKNGGSSWDNSPALASLLSRTTDVKSIDRLTQKFTLADTLKAMNHLESRPHDAQAKERFVRLATGVGDVGSAARLNGIMGGLQAPVYDAYVGVVEQLASGSKAQSLLVDFAMLAAYSNSPEEMAHQAQAFTSVVKAVGDKTDQAGPIFAELRAGSATPQELDVRVAAFVAKPFEPKPAVAGDPVTFTREEMDKILTWRDAGDAMKALEGMKTDQQGNFIRLLQATRDLPMARRGQAVTEHVAPELAQRNLAVLEGLVAQRGGQGSPDVLLDYLTLLTGRRAEQTLEEVATEYGALLSGVNSLGKPEEAAPTFAWIRQAQAGGQKGTTRELTDKFLKSFLVTGDAEKSRQLMFADETAPSGVQETSQTVVVGGIRINKKRG